MLRNMLASKDMITFNSINSRNFDFSVIIFTAPSWSLKITDNVVNNQSVVITVLVTDVGHR